MSPPRFPPAELRRALAELRDQGVPFPEAWPRAWRSVRWPHTSEEAKAWRQALVATRDEWQAAYERAPSSAQGLAELSPRRVA